MSNEVGGPLVSTARFVGVDLRDLLLEAGVQRGADQLLSTSVDGWTAGTPTAVVLEPDRGALLAVGMNGEALPREHGFPVRMVVPGLYGYVSATKWVTDLELTTFDARDAYWVQRGWAQQAPIKTQSRIDVPQRVRASPRRAASLLAGTAWAQHAGVGARARCAPTAARGRTRELAAEVNRDTWRMWRAELDLGPGRHELQCRATDRSGATQPEQRTRTGAGRRDGLAHGRRHGLLNDQRRPRTRRPAHSAPTPARPRASTIRSKIATLCTRSRATTVARRRRQYPSGSRFVRAVPDGCPAATAPVPERPRRAAA